ncbi:MAG: hypothetical protein KAQ68_03585 [Clostridiales bacterium]|nr:hypothetical protein [Clostridiales bacterium]
MLDTSWLLSTEDWIAYRTRLDLLNESLDENAHTKTRNQILSQPLFNAILTDLDTWPGNVLKRHNDSSQLIHKLAFLADVGIQATDNDMPSILDKIRTTQSDDGVYQVLMNIPTHFSGTGQDSMSWMFCDAPTILYALAKMGLDKDAEVLRATRYLVNLQDDNGFRCMANSDLGKFRGPGKKTDPCPYANLIMLKLLSEFNTDTFDGVINKSVESILNLWQDRKIRKEYLFGIGTDFKKLKAPLIWFDILHMLDVLSKFKSFHQDTRFKEMLSVLEEKMHENEHLTAQSMYRPWKEWEFANKKEPSRWITFLAYRIILRAKS